jgi:hypothetical protein
MTNRWKPAAMGTALVLATALVTSVTTAYLTRPAAVADAGPTIAPATPGAPRTVSAPPMGPIVPATAPIAHRTTPTARPAAYEPPPATTARAASGCATGGDRLLRVAKPGLIGGLVGAGLGAASGAIADGGKAAGRGALIGGLAGAVAGGGYGAYKTEQECGTVLGSAR